MHSWPKFLRHSPQKPYDFVHWNTALLAGDHMDFTNTAWSKDHYEYGYLISLLSSATYELGESGGNNLPEPLLICKTGKTPHETVGKLQKMMRVGSAGFQHPRPSHGALSVVLKDLAETWEWEGLWIGIFVYRGRGGKIDGARNNPLCAYSLFGR